jgi:uncharacterized glyoxalase superfamily protein PhnB
MPNEKLEARSLDVSLTVSDITRSMRLYIDGLGFEVAEKHDHHGQLIAVSLKSSDVRVLLSQDSFEKGRDRVKGLGVRLYLHTDQDLGELAEQAKAVGMTVERELRQLPWGPMGFTVTDPDGYQLAISRAD